MTTLIHKFEEAGLGKAPFKLVGMYSLPSTALAEHNPSAYNNALAAMPRDVACGSCAYCGMSLTHNFIIQSADQRKFVVGCDCVSKVGDKGLVDAIKLQKRRERQEERARNQAADARAILDAQREANGGLTDHEVREAQAAALAAQRAPLEEAIIDSLQPLISALNQKPGDFTRAMVARLNACDLDLSRGMVSTILEIAAKQAGRRGSKAYDAKWDTLAALWDQAVESYRALPA